MTEKVNETAAKDTLKPTPNGSSKAKMMADALAAMQGMKIEDLSHFLNDSLAQIGKEAEHVPGGAAAHNKASVSMKEDIDSVFGADLSEEFRERATTLFEAHVSQRVAIEMATLTEQVDAYLQETLNEEVSNQLEVLAENVDKFISYVADKWMEENALAVENGIRAELTESFMKGLKNLFMENYIEIPENKFDAFQAMTDKVTELEDKINYVTNQNIELQVALSGKERDSVFEEFKTGLTVLQIDKFQKLTEGLSYESIDDYRKKLKTIKESTFNVKHEETGILQEDSTIQEVDGTKKLNEDKTPVGRNASFLAALARSSNAKI